MLINYTFFTEKRPSEIFQKKTRVKSQFIEIIFNQIIFVLHEFKKKFYVRAIKTHILLERLRFFNRSTINFLLILSRLLLLFRYLFRLFYFQILLLSHLDRFKFFSLKYFSIALIIIKNPKKISICARKIEVNTKKRKELYSTTVQREKNTEKTSIIHINSKQQR